MRDYTKRRTSLDRSPPRSACSI